MTAISLGNSQSLGTNGQRTWNCPIFAELRSTLKPLSLRPWEDLLLNSRCNGSPSFFLLMETHARTGENSSYLPIFRGVSIAKGAGDHQDQSFMFQVHNVIVFHGYHLGGRAGGGQEGRGDEEREKVGENK